MLAVRPGGRCRPGTPCGREHHRRPGRGGPGPCDSSRILRPRAPDHRVGVFVMLPGGRARAGAGLPAWLACSAAARRRVVAGGGHQHADAAARLVGRHRGRHRRRGRRALVALLAMAEGFQTLRRPAAKTPPSSCAAGSASEVSSVLSPRASSRSNRRRTSPATPRANRCLGRGGGGDPAGGGRQGRARRLAACRCAGHECRPFGCAPGQDRRGPHASTRPARAGGRQGRGRQFAGLVPGQRSSSAPRPGRWSASSASGDAMDPRSGGDAATLADAYRRGSSRNSITAPSPAPRPCPVSRARSPPTRSSRST